jgi:hypothetical protein
MTSQSETAFEAPHCRRCPEGAGSRRSDVPERLAVQGDERSEESEAIP